MASILVTGASGFVGRGLAPALAARGHRVLCLSRHDPGLDLPWIRGDFGLFEDLRRLDGEAIDVVVHLGAVTGGCSERDAMLVNVEGTRCLLRYAVDRGCRKIVLASSIAVVGMQSPRFRPLRVPIPDEHPCLDHHGYGLSKYLMEELSRYGARQCDDLDVINLRLASVCPDDDRPPRRRAGAAGEWALGSITIMPRADAVRAFVLAAQAAPRPGVRVYNAAGPKAWVAEPTAVVLRSWWGDDVDLSAFERPGHETDGVFDVTRIRQELGFAAAVLR